MEANKVALCYHQPMPRLIEGVNGHAVYFDCKHSVSLVWVEEADVSILLGLKGGCCGGKSPLCHLATEGEIRVWTTGRR
jgi:hypothetical protein